jgi:hypothetical protein
MMPHLTNKTLYVTVASRVAMLEFNGVFNNNCFTGKPRVL